MFADAVHKIFYFYVIKPGILAPPFRSFQRWHHPDPKSVLRKVSGDLGSLDKVHWLPARVKNKIIFCLFKSCFSVLFFLPLLEGRRMFIPFIVHQIPKDDK